MLGILEGRVKDAPEIRPTKNGGSFISFTVSEKIEGFQYEYSRKCFIWQADNYDYVKDLQQGDKVEVRGEVRASVFEKDGKHLATITLNIDFNNEYHKVTKLDSLKNPEPSVSDKNSYFKEIELSIKESEVEELPF